MVPNTQPPSFVTGTGFNPLPPSPSPSLPQHVSADLAKIVAAVLPVFLHFQGLQAGMMPLAFQAALLDLLENPLPGDIPTEEGGPDILMPPIESPEETGQGSLEQLALIIAKNIDIGKPAGQNASTEASAAKESNETENETNLKEAPAAAEPKKVVKEQKKEATAVLNKLFEQGLENSKTTPKSLLKIPQEVENRTDTKQIPQEQKGENKEQKNIMRQHEWRHLKSSEICPRTALHVPKGHAAENETLNKNLPESQKAAPAKSLPEESKDQKPEEASSLAASKLSRDKNQPKPSDQELVERKSIEPDKSLKPRIDMIPLVLKKEEPDIPFKFHQPDLVKQMPVAAEQPFTREGIFKYANQNKNARLKQDEGYRFGDLIFMVFCAVLCGAKNSVDICRYLQRQEKFFKIWLGFKNNIPPFRLFWFLLNRLNPARLPDLLKSAIGTNSSDLAIHVRVWESNKGLIFGELNTDQHQMHLLSEVLLPFDLSGAAVTLDVPSLSPSLCRQIRRENGEFIVTLHEGFGSLYESVNSFFSDPSSANKIEVYKQTLEESQHIDVREIWVAEDILPSDLGEEMPYARQAIKLISEMISQQKRMDVSRYYLSSLRAKPEEISKTLRILSGLENKVEWLADCDFLYADIEEMERENMHRLQQITGHLLRKQLAGSGSLDSLRKKAAQDNTYLRSLTAQLEFHGEDFVL